VSGLAPPAHALAATTSAARHESIVRRLPTGNVNGSPGEDASTIVGTGGPLKCEETGRGKKGDSRGDIALPCHAQVEGPARRAPRSTRGAALRTGAAARRIVTEHGPPKSAALLCARSASL